MLFDIQPGLDNSRVFDGLDRFFREVILAALEGRATDQSQMPHGLYAAVTENQPTKQSVDKLLAALALLDPGRKDELKLALLHTEPCDFLTDRHLQLPTVPVAIFPHLKTLVTHLCERTAKLVGVEEACGERVDDHCARFRAMSPPGNGNVCCVCGTESLAQLQAGVDDHEQWRGPYDHLLAKNHYPLYGVHPKNLVPICQTCNSKTKLAKDLLYKQGIRRLSFVPWTERASTDEIHVSIDDIDMFPRVVVTFTSGNPDRQEKLQTWDDVYTIKGRVEGEFRALQEKVAEDVTASDEAAFLQDLRHRARNKANACRLTPFNYWRARVYRAVGEMDPGSREAFRLAIASATPQDDEMDDLFFT